MQYVTSPVLLLLLEEQQLQFFVCFIEQNHLLVHISTPEVRFLKFETYAIIGKRTPQ